MSSFSTIDRDQLDTVIGGVAARPPTPKLRPLTRPTKPTHKVGPRRPSSDLDPIVKYDGWGAYIGDW